MKKIWLLLMAAILMALAACSGQEPTPPPPTEAPPTSAPASESYVESLEHVANPQLIDISWQWERRDPNGNDIEAITVPNPEAYTLLFNADGSFTAQIDCNTATGQYATSGSARIFMELGPMTQAACSPESLADQMITMFGPAQNYRFEEDGNVLVFPWVAGGPVDYFRKE